MKASTVFTPIAILASASVSEASLGGAGRLAGSLAKSFGSNRSNGLNIVTECGHPDAICPDKMRRAGAWRFLNRRQVDGVPDHEYERCGEDAVNSPIQVTGNGQTVQATNVPASCMNIAHVFVGDGPGPWAQPCGSDCLIYENLSPEDYGALWDVLSQYQ